MITSINAGKSFDKIQHSFTIKSLHRVGTEGTDFSITKAIYDKLTANFIHNGERLKALFLRSETRQVCPLLQLFFQHSILCKS